MTHKTSMTGVLAWEHATREIPESGLSRKRQAAPDELAGIARALDLVACKGLRAAYTLKPTIDGRYRLWGTLQAEVSQTCIVTLEPVDSIVEESFDVAFWLQEDMPAPLGGALDIEEELDPEPIVAGQIDVGRVVFECLAATIDPFPRKEGASLDWRSQEPSDGTAGKPESPFAVLANIKAKT